MASSSSSSSKRKREMEENAFEGMTLTPLSATPASDPAFHRYDVFINHRGPDVKNTLASVLHQFLQYLGLKVFLDYPELQPGDPLPATIQQAIRSSQVHIAIFSPRYAESSWCLTELQLMLNTGAKIVPVFYDGVLYKDLRYTENGVYAHAFDTHEKKGRFTAERISLWKKSLHDVSYISGIDFHLSDGNLGHVYKNIVDTVLNEVSVARNKFKLEVADHPVGLDEVIQELEVKISSIEQNNNGNGKIVGIVGTAGVGKTTLAKEFYNRKYHMFYRSSFLFDVGETHRNKNMMKMQHKLMCDLRIPLSLSSATFEPSSPKEGVGVEMIKSQLERWYSKPLIILDGVDHADQLEALALNEFLNHGALVLVTCRDASVLQSLNDELVKIYEMRGLDPKYARQLFCWHAFRRSHPPKGRERLVETVLKVSGGLPLHLKGMGQEIYPMQKDIDAEL
ncbi:hypothetical protein SUGI_0674270 [Cryptomeria japonica]|uniref:disease resistance protein Roq1 n=1 Tax=Cryptomeria japonica TaxID=3369 RepID=UPI0024146E83|nr:disease resistance protein Roq1 [Cryptomeria japonica]GLJ33529.1 hypothetical protein SUGI_0674270 [Cryptomeria japonica]